jgi:chitin-binding protein
MTLGTKTQTSIALSWQASTDDVGVDHYNVYRGTSAAATDQVKVAETGGLTYTYSGLTCGTDYSLGLEAVDAAGNRSSLSEAIWYPARTLDCSPPPSTDLPPAKPVLTVCATTSRSATLCWPRGESDLDGYRMYADGALIATVGPQTTTYTFKTPARRTYRLGVEPFDKAGQKTLSEVYVATR